MRLGHDSFWCDYTLRIPDAGVVPPGVDRMDPALPRAHRADRGHHRPLRRLRDLAGQPPEAGRAAAPDQHPASSRLPATSPRPRAVKCPRFDQLPPHFVDKYMTVDARSLGFGRIGLALVLLFDLVRRIPVITLFYSNEGLIPNHMMLWRPPTQWMFSFFFILSHPDEVAVGFAFCALVYLFCWSGWRTRMMQVLAVICVHQLARPRHAARERRRLDAGRAGAVDGVPAARAPLLRRRRCGRACGARRETTRRRARPTGRRWTSSGERGRLRVAGGAGGGAEIANSYIFNAVHKGGPTWRRGRRCTTCYTRTGCAPGSRSGCART